MIQTVPSHRQPPFSTAAHAPQADGPHEWGKWSNDRYYSLEIAQHPLRARMCGFGDKDRRPIAPAVVAKMIVRTKDNQTLEPDKIDPTFFVVTVDLWSEDGTKEMNLVLHPSSSAERNPPIQAPKPKRRGTQSVPQSGMHSPLGHGNTPGPPQHHARPPGESQAMASSTNPMPASPRLGHDAFGESVRHQVGPISDSMGNNASQPFPTSTQPGSNPWTYTPQIMQYNSSIVPAISSTARVGVASSPSANVAMSDPWGTSNSSFRPWPSPYPNAMGTYPPNVSASSYAPASAASDPAAFGPPGQARYPSGGYGNPGLSSSTTASPQLDVAGVGSTYSHTPTGAPQYASALSGQSDAAAASDAAPSKHAYTRTLVGPLSANATPLKDQHRQPGIFFLFQDLSVRTEGTFRLRLRLMNIGPPNIPGVPYQVNTGASGVLAQCYTDPFVVYSAKRFPGVPDTTALSIAFGNQGQKLPLRSKNGESKGRRRKRADEYSGSDDDYD